MSGIPPKLPPSHLNPADPLIPKILILTIAMTVSQTWVPVRADAIARHRGVCDTIEASSRPASEAHHDHRNHQTSRPGPASWRSYPRVGRPRHVHLPRYAAVPRRHAPGTQHLRRYDHPAPPPARPAGLGHHPDFRQQLPLLRPRQPQQPLLAGLLRRLQRGYRYHLAPQRLHGLVGRQAARLCPGDRLQVHRITAIRC